MRRLTASLLAVGLLLPVVGCHHMAGICDCDFTSPVCYWQQAHGGCHAPVVTAEQLKQVPKTVEKAP